MTQRIRIKDIAEMAKVSPGTVDRVLHNRGNISESSRRAVEAALKSVNYKPNLYLSSISIQKTYTIAIVTPEFIDGEYWAFIRQGILSAIEKFDSINIICNFFVYNQFDINSYIEVNEKVLNSNPSGIIIGPTFKDKTINFTNSLEKKSIPYVFVDSMVEGTSPHAYFSSDQYMCGYLIGKLIDCTTPPESEYVLFQSVRIGDQSGNITALRKAGFVAYFQERGLKNKILRINFSVVNPESNKKLIGNFFEKHPNVRGVAVLSSRGSVIADYFKENNINDIKLVCVDLTDSNYKAIQENLISFAIAQRPTQQGFMAIKTLVEFFLYHKKVVVKNILPIDIITKENSESYIEFRNSSSNE